MSTSSPEGPPQTERPADLSRFDRPVPLLLAALTVLVVPFGALLALVQVGWAPLWALDRGAAQGLHDLVVDRPAVVAATRVVTDAGDGMTWWILLSLTGVYLVLRRQGPLALFVAVAGIGGGLLNRAVKAAVGRQRPELTDPVSQATGFAFPSGHTMSSAIGVSVLLLVLVPLLAPRWRRLAVVVGVSFAVAVGLSRVVLGVHWVSDVIGAWLLSVAWMLTMIAIFRPTVSPTSKAAATADRGASRRAADQGRIGQRPCEGHVSPAGSAARTPIPTESTQQQTPKPR